MSGLKILVESTLERNMRIRAGSEIAYMILCKAVTPALSIDMVTNEVSTISKNGHPDLTQGWLKFGKVNITRCKPVPISFHSLWENQSFSDHERWVNYHFRLDGALPLVGECVRGTPVTCRVKILSSGKFEYVWAISLPKSFISLHGKGYFGPNRNNRN